jgi:flagellar biosynthesis protein FlhG
VITVASGKGGVGKTNVSVNLAAAQAARGQRVMLLDADLGLANVDVLLGLEVGRNLEDVLEGRCSLEEIVVTGPAGVRVVPAASGVKRLANLDSLQASGIVRAFSELTADIDLLIVDAAAGINTGVTTFAAAAHEVLVVVCDEPASITDAYALVKVLAREHGIRRFHVLANMVRNATEGRGLYRKIARVAETYLDVVLRFAGYVPHDDFLRRALQRRSPVVTEFPEVGASIAFKKLGELVDTWDRPARVSGNIGFFLERALGVDAHAEEAER